MTRPWKSIHEFYLGLAAASPACQALAGLAAQISTSRYASGLHGWTSHRDLCVVQSAVVHPFFGPYLRVSPVEDGHLEFRYLDCPDESKQWHRLVEGQRGFQCLERFLDHLHWFGGAK